ncbi:MAG TPA: hypothetical protein VML54_03530 [Candidatus Limnocylindrales bacterium]|nr:hypothetical protein [Candidatus Limnocylindrales bacterium]
MRLIADEHPEAIKRYDHVRPATGRGGRRCGTRCDGTPLSCTRERGHGGPHVAHARFRRVVAVWDAKAGAAAPGPPRHAPEAPPARTRAAQRPVGLPDRSTGLLQALRARLARALASAEEIVFLIFFLAFVGFAVHWLLLITG